MKLNELAPQIGVKKKAKRIGRVHGSGQGKTSGKGQKGQKARSGAKIRRGFEGGQMPLQRRVAKRGFNNIFSKKIIPINLNALNVFEDGSVVDEMILREKGIIKGKFDGVKILAKGTLEKKLTIKLAGFSQKAKQEIEKVGGKAEVV
jgi:large subunit ribosomal protein L15